MQRDGDARSTWDLPALGRAELLPFCVCVKGKFQPRMNPSGIQTTLEKEPLFLWNCVRQGEIRDTALGSLLLQSNEKFRSFKQRKGNLFPSPLCFPLEYYFPRAQQGLFDDTDKLPLLAFNWCRIFLFYKILWQLPNCPEFWNSFPPPLFFIHFLILIFIFLF